MPVATPEELAAAARRVRLRDLDVVSTAGMGHIGGEFSVTDILVTLYLGVIDQGAGPDRDHVVLSKGHAAVALYATLAEAGLLPDADLDTFANPDSPLNGHPARTKLHAVEASTGPLGHGLPIGVGMAIAAELEGASRRTFVIVGDGELQEGSNWEAMMIAAHRNLDRLVLVVDRNGLQQGAPVADTSDLEPLADKFRAFGWAVAEVDGHDHRALREVLSSTPWEAGRPSAVIARTHKGHPVSFMSDNPGWHHRVPNADEVRLAREEIAAT
ncbi:MAG: transketolase [Actinobacteria bacterium]|nr:transketolase [Actinomycetota bacterium]